MGLLTTGLVAQDEREWEADEGYHEEEWYDPSDWWNDDQQVDYESDWFEDDYDDDYEYDDYDYHDDYRYRDEYDYEDNYYDDRDQYEYDYRDQYDDEYQVDRRRRRRRYQTDYDGTYRDDRYDDQDLSDSALYEERLWNNDAYEPYYDDTRQGPRNRQRSARRQGRYSRRQGRYNQRQDRYSQRDDRQDRSQRQRRYDRRGDQRRMRRQDRFDDQRGRRMQRRRSRQRVTALTKGSKLTGKQVVGPDGREIGKLKDIVIDAQQGRATFAIVCPSESGRVCKSVPWQLISLRRDGKQVRLNLRKQQFRDAPQMSPDDITEDMGSRQFNQKVTQHWRQETRGRVRLQGHPIKLSELMGKSVQSRDDKDVGDIEDVVLSVQSGRLVYALLSLKTRDDQQQQKMAVVPFEVIDPRPQKDKAQADASSQAIRRRTYEPGNEPDFSSRRLARQSEQEFDTVYLIRGYTLYIPAEQARNRQQDRERQGRQQRQRDRDQRNRDQRNRDQQDRGRDRGQGTRRSWRQFRQANTDGGQKNLQGTIQSVGTYRPSEKRWHSRRLRLKTQDGKFRTVLIGPERQIRQKDLNLHPGDEVTVKGSATKINGRKMFIASSLSKDGDTVELED
jgi:sporulation protein YlmC with PRC-barrel domain